MRETSMNSDENPLLKYIRTPAATLELSSQGKFWPEGTLKKTHNLTVFPMTGQDEILLLSTNYMLLGSVLAEIIANCIPDIVDVWSMPRIDLDSILIAIRCASYNESMNVQFACSKCKNNQTHSVNLPEISSQISIPDYTNPLLIGELAVWFRPVTFAEHFQQVVDQNSKVAVIKKLSNESLTDEEKQQIINQNLRQMTAINIANLANSIDRILIDSQATVRDKEFIKDWLMKLDRETFATVSTAIGDKIQEYSLPKKTFVCKNEECKHENELVIDFNPADFLNKGD
jgi:T4 bacteriophage base plate protein